MFLLAAWDLGLFIGLPSAAQHQGRLRKKSEMGELEKGAGWWEPEMWKLHQTEVSAKECVRMQTRPLIIIQEANALVMQVPFSLPPSPRLDFMNFIGVDLLLKQEKRKKSWDVWFMCISKGHGKSLWMYCKSCHMHHFLESAACKEEIQCSLVMMGGESFL